MLGIIVATHAPLATGLIKAASLICANMEHIYSIEVELNKPVETFEESFNSALQKLRNCSGILILTDLFGGTPSHIAMTKHSKEKIEVITGVNLPMLTKALSLATSDQPLSDVATQVSQSAKSAIVIAGEVLTSS
ncbi:MAG: PTS sugar transporter subunit IIA [Myxococcota bacterium]|nr:PTS sugar transporter subunit IIA [Myxococcota bacterium]